MTGRIIASASTSTDLLRLTQVGTGNAFVVEDSTNPDITPFVIQGDGKVAIGTSSTVANFEVRATGANGILLGPDLSGAIASSRLFFSNGITGQHSAILNTSGNIDFRTDGTNNSSTGTNRMVIERTTGNVGIAQFNPLSRLHVEPSSTGIGILATGSTTQDLVRITQTGTGNAFVVEDSNNPDSTPFVIQTDGKVAIGTSSTTHLLSVYNGDADILLVERGNSLNATIQYKNTIGSFWTGVNTTGNFGIGTSNNVSDSSTTSFMIARNTGNIGIGTMSPGAKLHVVSQTSGAVRIQDGTEQAGYVLTSDANGLATWQVSSGGGSSLSGTINYVPFYKTTTTLSSTSSIQVSGDTVGIGVSFSNTGGPSTDYRLHVNYGSGTYGVLIEGGGGISENIPLRLWDSGTGTNNINILEFGHATASPKLYVPGARIKSTNPGSGATTGAHLILETSSISNPTSTTWNTNQLYLRNDGNVGIGTNTPTSYLTINTPGGSLYSGGSTGEHAILIGSQSTGSVAAYIGTDETLSAMYIQSGIRGGAATPILLNAQGGNIGIGVTLPAAKLHAVTNVSTIPLIIASGSTTVDLVRITQVGTGNAIVVEDSTNPDTTPFAITNTGKVKVGTTTDSTYSSNIYSISTTYGLEAYGDLAGVYARGLTYGIVAEAATDGMVVAGIMASATNDQFMYGVYYGGMFSANSSNGVNYAVSLQDGSQGLNKVLVDTIGDGSANWKSDLSITSIIASASSTSDIVRITQTGTGNALVVEDSTNPDATPFVITSTGNVAIGTQSTNNTLHVQGSMELTGTFSGSNSNFVDANLITQTVLLYMSNNT